MLCFDSIRLTGLSEVERFPFRWVFALLVVVALVFGSASQGVVSIISELAVGKGKK